MYETCEKNEIYLQYSAGSVAALQRHARSAWIHSVGAVGGRAAVGVTHYQGS